MRVALSLARRQSGQTHPNPNVGAVIVKDGQTIAHGITANGGRPHAETIAINNALDKTNGATLYVTLEPCSHHGKTPPCVDAIIASGIKTVVIACTDKNPKIKGSGIAALKNSGIEVIENICEKKALEINQGFFSVIEKNRPYIALKIATSLDGKITSSNQRWLTGEPARNYGHLLRAQYDAILTGVGTVLADDPLLTCRLNGLESRSPIRIVLDRNKRIPKTAKLLNDGHGSLIMSEELPEVIDELTKRGITSILVEAGAKLTNTFLESGLVDKAYWFRAPIIIGEEGLDVNDALAKLASFAQIEHIKLGNDTLDILKCSQE
jgi:diaminohydroxyphosphoribosylaminopyrimidine deaminase / 5-amino-6-(5-phosphoribosylamino)uracil reductase